MVSRQERPFGQAYLEMKRFNLRCAQTEPLRLMSFAESGRGRVFTTARIGLNPSRHIAACKFNDALFIHRNDRLVETSKRTPSFYYYGQIDLWKPLSSDNLS